MMNSNRGVDPMLSSLMGDSMWNTKIIAEPVSFSPDPRRLPLHHDRLVSPVPDVLLSPDPNQSYSDLEFLWGNERKRVTSIKMEEEDTFSPSPCSVDEVDSSEMDLEDCDIKSELDISMLNDNDSNISCDTNADVAMSNSCTTLDFCDSEATASLKVSGITESAARKYIDTQFSKIAYVPSPNSSHREKIRYILSHSDCQEYSIEDVLNLDKRSADSARICAKIVQNIPQRYRWECVEPEDIPCCYTIVADCKKVSNRDKAPRPMNAFMIWAQGARRLINELCPKMQNAAISEALGFYWRQKSDEFKQRFEMEKVKLRRFHNVEFPQYKYKPKTKIQKAKEKKELSMSKSKTAKTAVKRVKIETPETESDSANIRKKSKYGRPRKTKEIFEPSQQPQTMAPTPLQHTVIKSEPVETSPAKPAIKDMLSMKILNDRRSKGMTIITPTETIQTCLGQLSPLEVATSTGTGDVFDELREFEAQMNAREQHSRVMGCNRFISSSVYDTPANTPPLDDVREHSLSPVHSPSSTTSSIVSPSPTSEHHHDNRNTSCPSTQLLARDAMPSLKAILSSGSITVRPISHVQKSLSDSLPVTSAISAKYTAQRNSGRSELGSVKVKSEVQTYPFDLPISSPVHFFGITSNTSESDKDKNNNDHSMCDANNNNNRNSVVTTKSTNSDLEPNNRKNSFVARDVFLSKPLSLPASQSSIFTDFSDLDCLSLDINVPLFSDDIMKSLLNTI